MGNNLCCFFYGESKARQGEQTAVSDLSELQSMRLSSCPGPCCGVGKARVDGLEQAYIDSFTYEKSHTFSGEEFGVFTVKKQQKGQFSPLMCKVPGAIALRVQKVRRLQ